MPTFLQENRMLAWSLAGVAFLVAFLLILKIVEIAADLRRRLPRGSKSRQLRLGFVESYDLDGERQLMLVRRDNIEHLLMIGGPNDVLVESGIVRVEPREARPPRPMEALAGVAPAAAGRGAASRAFGARAPHRRRSSRRPPPSPPTRSGAARRAAERSAAGRRRRAGSGAARAACRVRRARPAASGAALPASASGRTGQAAFAPPPRFTPPGAPAGDQPPRPRFVAPTFARRVTPPPAETPVEKPAAPPFDGRRTAPPVEALPPLPPLPPFPAPEPKPEVKLEPEPVAESKPEPAAEPAPPPEPVAEAKFDLDFEPLESLEEEMAKLLGRPLNK